ncbi:MAG: CDP-alcohol phosphatidyltransferase family protein [Actinomycetota bacterium]
MDGEQAGGAPASLDRIATFPNLLSLTRILLIPVFVWLILNHGTEAAGLILLTAVVATDWIDGYVARRTGQVSNLGKILDPVADRMALTAALVALVARDAFPLWAALLVIARDVLILLAGVVLLARYRIRLDVRWVGKAATFGLMCAIPLVAWGSFDLFLHGFATTAGWVIFVPAIALYYLAAAVYSVDVVRAVRHADPGAAHRPEQG